MNLSFITNFSTTGPSNLSPIGYWTVIIATIMMAGIGIWLCWIFRDTNDKEEVK